MEMNGNDPDEWMEMNNADQGGREEGRQSLQALLGRRSLCFNST
jgi:hypothetical protein